MRRFGPNPERGRRYRRRPGAYAVIRHGDAVLLTVEHSPFAGTEVQLPGGGIDPGESPVRALHREALEETGWRIAVTGRLGCYQRFTYMPDYDLWAHKVCHVFLARPTLCVGPPREDHHQVIWSDRSTVASLITDPSDRAFYQSVLHRIV